MIKKYIWNNLIAWDQLINALFGGDPDESMSSRLGKWVGPKRESACWACKNSAKVICAVLHLIDPNHCEKSIETDEGKDALI